MASRPCDPRSVPAAHSMDTAWFGVDADGELAVFDTGEAGAFPQDAAGTGEHGRPLGGFDDGFEAICAALDIDPELVYEPDDRLPVHRYEHESETGWAVAGGPFQSMSCLARCAPSPRFASIGWDRSVAWCSYTTTRRPLQGLTASALTEALSGLGLRYCGEASRA